MMYNSAMRTTITIDDDLHQFVAYYARAKGLTVSAAIGELIRKGETAPEPEPDIRRTQNGFPIFPPTGADAAITSDMVKKLEEEAFDPKAFA